MQIRTNSCWYPQYAVDVVLCIDGTQTMNDIGCDGQSKLDSVKGVARRIGTDICETMNRYGKTVEKLRIRIIVFRDYWADGEHAMMASDFFRLPQQATEFEACINNIRAEGGGDPPEDGLEALAYAIRSKWDTEHSLSRSVIIVWSDAETHNLGFGSSSEFYPKGMPSDLDELSDWWDNPAYVKERAKRLFLFAPDGGSWKYISDNWNCAWHIPSAAGNSLRDFDYQNILQSIVHNV